MANGYSGRSFDTKYVTPFLKSKKFAGAMRESGWLTRSLEQNIPYNLDYPGKIRDTNVKSTFLNLINNIEEKGSDPEEILTGLFQRSIYEKSKRAIVLINPIESESEFTISDIMNYLVKLFYYKYKVLERLFCLLLHYILFILALVRK